MTRVLIDDADRAGRRAPRIGRGDLRRVPNARREGARSLRPRRVGREDIAVRLEMRTAASRVDHDRQLGPGERVDVQACELARAVAIAAVRVQGPAADLLDARGHLPSAALEDAHRRAIAVTEDLAHDAAREEERVGVVAFDELERRTLAPGSERRRPGERARSGAAYRGRDRRARVQIGETWRPTQPLRIGDRREGESLERASEASLPLALVQHLARALHDPAERDAARARGLARATHQTRVEMA